jgi:hypothetical protein
LAGAIPDLQLIKSRFELNYDTVDLVFISELVSNQGEAEIFPVLVSVSFGNTDSPLSSIFALFLLPHGFDSLSELISLLI